MINRNMRKKINLTCALAMAFALVLSGCSQSASTAVKDLSDSAIVASAATTESTEDIEIGDATAEVILSDSGSEVSGTGVEIDGSDIVIKSGGTYSFTGSLSEGRIKVEAEGKEVQIILNGVTITNSEKDAIYIEEAASAVIYVTEGTENNLTSGTKDSYEEAKTSVSEANSSDETASDEDTTTETAADEEEGLSNSQKATIMSKCDLTIAGSGTLNVNGYINNGIQSKTNLTIGSVSLTVVAANDAVKGGESVNIESGVFDLTAVGDAVQSDGTLYVADGSFTVKTGDGAASAEKKSDNMFGGGFGGMHMKSGRNSGETSTNSTGDNASQSAEGERPDFANGERPDFANGEMPQMTEGELPELPSGEAPQMTEGERPELPDGEMPQMAEGETPQMPSGDSSDSDMSQMFGMMDDAGDSYDSDSNSVSRKGFKSDGDMTISGGVFVMDTVDDAIHSNASLTIEGGEYTIQAGDDAVHAEAELVVDGGNITVDTCYEGLEASHITVNDGDINVTASDDGFNASSSGNDSLITINGGSVYVSSDGDGIDSNKDIVINGGTVYVDGPGNGGNAAIDVGTENQGTFVINGGTVTGIGMSSMLENADESSTQQTVTYVFDETLEAGTEITIKDASGNVVAEVTTTKSANAITYSSDQLKSGETYTFTASDLSGELTADSINATNSSGGMGFGGFGGGMRQGGSGKNSGGN
jgi:hypothetical protein